MKGTPKVLLTGPNANSMWAMCGDYTYPAMSYFWKKMEDTPKEPHIVNLLEGMKESKPEDINLMYSRGCDWTEEIETKFSELGDERAWEYEILHRKVDSGEKADKAEALKMAQQCDVIVAAMGENVMLCGENRDRTSLRLPGKQEQFVEELIKTGKPVVLVMFGGRAQVISGLAEKCAAVIQAWYPGEEGGKAVADILYGKVSPSAKLSVSYPNTEINEPICYNYSAEKDARVQWPFGYGLSYTTFEYANLKVDKTSFTEDDVLTVSVDVKNTGARAGKEAVLLYSSDLVASIVPDNKRLRDFTKIALESGETKTVTFQLPAKSLAFVGADGKWTLEEGDFILKIGNQTVPVFCERTKIWDEPNI